MKRCIPRATIVPTCVDRKRNEMNGAFGKAVLEVLAPHMFRCSQNRSIPAQDSQSRRLFAVCSRHGDRVEPTATARIEIQEASQPERPLAWLCSGETK